MACKLNKDQIKDVYGLLYKRLSDPNKAADFNINKFVKEIYNAVTEATEDPAKGLLYAQAVPDILDLVKMDTDVKKNLINTGFDFNTLMKLSLDFEDLQNVQKAVADKKKSSDEVKKEIKAVNEASKNEALAEPLSPNIQWSYNQNNGAKIAYPLATVYQAAYSENPETVSEEKRNEKDPEKKLFYDVIKDIVYITRKRLSDSDEVIYQDKSLALKAMKADDFPEEYLTRADKDFMISRPEYKGILAVVTDTNGDYVYFKPDGSVTNDPKEGRIVYQYLRKVNLVDGKLYLSSQSDYNYTLISPEVLAKREFNLMKAAGVNVSDEQLEEMTKQISDKQTKELNDLYRLRQYVLSQEGTPVMLAINNGTFGISTNNVKTITLEQSGISEEDVVNYEQISDDSELNGQQFFTIVKERPGVSIDQRIFLQRGDITDEIADKIATVLTTTAKLKGKELTPEERKIFFEVFINNTLPKNRKTNRDRITAKVAYRDGKLVLAVSIDGNEIPQEELYTEESKQLIYNHLLNAVKKEYTPNKKDAEPIVRYYRANVQYNSKYKDGEFTDYEIDGDTITETSKNYFNTIKPIIKVTYTDEIDQYDNGLNAYLTYTIPQNIVPAGEEIFQPGMPEPTKKKPQEKVISEGAQVVNYSKYSEAKEAANKKEGIWVMRPATGLETDITFEENFGNPWSTKKDSLSKYVKLVDTVQEAVKNYENWLLGKEFKNVQQKRRKWILDKINSGDLDSAKFIYYKPKKNYVSHADVLVAMINNRDKTEVPKIVEPKPVKKTAEEHKQVDDKIVKVNLLSDILNQPSRTVFKREKLRQSFFDKVFTSKADLKKADDWWNNSGLSQIKVNGRVLLPLERITEIVNSDAFATFTQNGITLFEADGGTSIDVYHEAWHGFSQLVLTNEEKTKLYEELRTNPKWADAEFFDIEEDIAEDFRSFMKFKKKFPGFLGKVFEAIGKLLRKMYGKITRQDMTRPRDIAAVREYYDLLFQSDKNPDVFQRFNPSVNNLMFTKLNRSKTIQPLKSMSKNYTEFTVEESSKAVRVVDNLMGIIFQNYNRDNNTTSGAVRILNSPQNRVGLYKEVRNRLEEIRVRYAEEYERVFFENEQSETPDLFLQNSIAENMMFFTKLVDNFGNVEQSLNKEQKTGLVAYHMKKSKFSVLKESYKDLTEDPTNLDNSQIFKLDGGNTVSSKEIASEETIMLLSSIFKVERNKDNEIEYVLDEFGIPQLENTDVIWNRLAKILAGSFDETEMYQRIAENSNNYPELYQLQNLLPNPFTTITSGYATSSEFDAETKFWQDLKKPRIPYIQLNLTKETTGEKKGTYEARLSKANFDVYKVINDWTSNFTTGDSSTNPYIVEDEDPYGRNMLNINKILADFGSKSLLNSKESLELLSAIGINLDTSSPAIMNIINSKTELFSNRFGVNRILSVLKQVNKSTDKGAVDDFRRNPLGNLIKGLEYNLRLDKSKSKEMAARIRVLAELQNMYSDSYSNFSVLSPERNRVWEHFLDNTITRVITSLRKAENWQQLTSDEADPNGIFKHMRWLSNTNNTFSEFSKLLNSVFYLDPLSPNYGTKKKDANIILNNVAGTQLVSKSYDETTGVSTASTDATSKFLQELNTMLLNGIEEFMRHASKNTAMGVTMSNKIETYGGKQSDKLYVDIEAFRPGSFGPSKAFDILAGYLSGEANRIFRFESDKKKYAQFAGYNRETRRKDGKIVMAGQAFTAFDDVLSVDVQKELYAIINNAVKNNQADFNMIDVLNSDLDLRQRVENDVTNYFNKLTKRNQERLNKARYIDPSLVAKVDQKYVDFTSAELDEILVKAYAYNSWMHKFETAIIAYGDFVQYNHDKEEFHKRNAGLGSGGRGFRSDLRAQSFVNNPVLFKRYYADRMGYTMRKYDGTLNSAIIKEIEIPSVMYDEYLKELEDVYYKRLGNKEEAKKLAKIAMKEYEKMKIADGQGHITFESYRMLKKLEGNWTDSQEFLYRKVSIGENITIDDVVNYFPPYKLQYYGNIQTTGLPITSFHKFSLAPIIPGVVKEGTPLYDLHMKMMDKDQQIDYVLFESGSKVGHIGSGDQVLNSDGTFNKDVNFTKNVVFAEYLKNQTEVNASYKKKSIFSTQMRKLILEGLYEKGQIETTQEDKITNPIVKRYLNNVAEYSELLKIELLEEIGYEEKSPNNYVPRDKSSMGKLVNLIRENLEREDLVSDDLIDFIDVSDTTGEIIHDLSLHPESTKIEKLLLSLVNKRLIKQKVKGEPLVQVSSALYNNTFRVADKLKAATKEDIRKWAPTNVLPTYHKLANGNTSAMKVMIAMQGDYYNLFNLEYADQETVGVYFEDGNIDMDTSLSRLNEKLKDDEWLDKNNGANRKAITMVGVRIPVQGLNSMEFMEVYEFLAPQAGNIIIPPAEIVAKSGGDFDIDKLTIFMGNINFDGSMAKKEVADNAEVKKQIKELRDKGESIQQLLSVQKAGLENQLIEDIRNILQLPQNYASLITPNGTFILKNIAQELSEDVMDYDPFQNIMSEESNKSVDNKKVISPTRVLEALYNIYKHESNIVGKKTLGLGAIENTFNVIMNAAGAYMPNTFTDPKGETREAKLYLRHNKMIVDGEEVISISNRYDVENKHKIADIISQMMNGWVDVEKDAWIFFIQGNYEVAPTLLYLVKAGVPVEDAIYFVSNPLVRDYVNEQRMAKSTFADVLGKKPDSPNFAKYQAATEVINKYFEPDDAAALGKNIDRYNAAIYYANKNGEIDHFKTSEMRKLISAFKEGNISEEQNDLAKAMFLHYLQIEQQIGGLTQLKMNTNPDTSTKSTLSDVERTESNIENLMYDDRIPKKLLMSLMNDSVISSFFNGPLSLAISRPLFKLKYHKAISDYLIVKGATLRDDAEATFGENKVDTFINTFRNDIVSFIFQNALKRYKPSETYMSYDLKTKVPVKYASELKRGAFVKEEAGEKTLYLDLKQLRKEFKEQAWVRGSSVENSYQERGLYPLELITFKRNKSMNFNEYIRFVSEREYLRSEFPIGEVSQTKYFKDEMKSVKQTNPDVPTEKVARFTYEKYIAEKALDNIFNIYYQFKNKNTALAVRLSDVITNNTALKSKFEVLKYLKLDSNQDDSTFNIYLTDKDMNSQKATEYTKNLQDLANPAVIKVSDPEENQRISDLFSKLSLFAFMQTGLNKTKLSFTSIVNYSDFLEVVEEESKAFMNALDQNGNAILDNFYNLFMQQNSIYNNEKNRFKDYLSAIDYSNAEKVKTLTATTPLRKSQNVDVVDEPTAPGIYKRFGLTMTTDPNIFSYDGTVTAPNFYQNLTDKNQDVVFVGNASYREVENNFVGVNLGGQSYLNMYAEDMYIPIMTNFKTRTDAFKNLKSESYPTLIENWEKAIKSMKDIIDKGGKLAFPESGFGDSTAMPKELFVYLSRRLYQEFGYVNPGSTMYEEIRELVGRTQGITDEEILQQLGLEEDPFKCA